MSEILCFDLDNTLCKTEGSNYLESRPIIDNINIVNSLYDEGNTIIIQTARGARSDIDWFDFTEKQLKEWGVKYHKLFLGNKPHADRFIDDKAENSIEFFMKQRIKRNNIKVWVKSEH